jgi:hypothetical protein
MRTGNVWKWWNYKKGGKNMEVRSEEREIEKINNERTNEVNEREENT